MILKRKDFVTQGRKTLLGRRVFDEEEAYRQACSVRDKYRVLFIPCYEVKVDRDGNITTNEPFMRKDRYGYIFDDLSGLSVNLSRDIFYTNAYASKDVKKICRAVNANNIAEVRHGYTIGGRGFFTVTDRNGKSVSVPSVFELTTYGAAWSLSSCRRLYFGQASLIWYLEAVKEKLRRKNPGIVMDIKPLYITYLYNWKRTFIEIFKDSGFMRSELLRNADEILADLEEQYPGECDALKRQAGKGEPWDFGDSGWYNGDAENSLNDVCVAIEKAINTLYSGRDAFEKNHMWDKVKEEIRSLNRLKEV